MESIDGLYRLNLGPEYQKATNNLRSQMPTPTQLDRRILGICPDCNGEAALETYYDAKGDKTYLITRCLKTAVAHIVSKSDMVTKQSPRRIWSMKTGLTCKPRKELVCDGQRKGES